MIAHAFSIIVNELNRHLKTYDLPDSLDTASNRTVPGNLSEGFASGAADSGAVPRNKLVLSVVNITEEKTLKNLPSYVRSDDRLSVTYENPPIFLTVKILLTATHTNYLKALLMLSRGLQFFQHRPTFTQNDVDPESLIPPPELDRHLLDQLTSFKLVFDLYSPGMEEVNHLWGTLGGKQYPFALYIIRVLDLKFKVVQPASGVITEVISDVRHKIPVVN